MFAIIETGGKQFKVSQGDKIQVEKFEGEKGSTFKIEKVLLISDKGDPIIGKPYIKGASISGKVLEHDKTEKLVVLKMKAKKRYKRTQGHRQNFTTLEITEIKAADTKASTLKPETKESSTKEETTEKSEKPKKKTTAKTTPKTV